MKDNSTKKAFMRNKIFHESNSVNKKLGSIPTAKIESVYWIDKKQDMSLWPVKEFVEMMEANDYFGIV
jgi:hypothetical protein